jgi:hypothetical protein
MRPICTELKTLRDYICPWGSPGKGLKAMWPTCASANKSHGLYLAHETHLHSVQNTPRLYVPMRLTCARAESHETYLRMRQQKSRTISGPWDPSAQRSEHSEIMCPWDSPAQAPTKVTEYIWPMRPICTALRTLGDWYVPMRLTCASANKSHGLYLAHETHLHSAQNTLRLVCAHEAHMRKP